MGGCPHGGPFRIVDDHKEAGYALVYSLSMKKYGYLFYEDMMFFPDAHL